VARLLHCAITFFVCLSLAPVPALSDVLGQGYRLAGTLAVGADYVAFLEVPGGGQVLVRKGSIVNGAKVVAVTGSSVRLALPTGLVEYSLEGSGKAQPAAGSDAIISGSTDQKNRVYNREVSIDQMSRELAKPAPARAAAAGSKSASDAAGTASPDSAAQRITAVLDLPPGSKIMKIANVPVSSADQAIKAVESAFKSPEQLGVVIDVETPTGPGRVYLRRGDH
jgi:hypothetical protein